MMNDLSLSSSNHSINQSSGSSGGGERRGSMKKRRDSKILLEGVEYDLSNLLTKEVLEAESDSDSEEETGGYLPCNRNNNRNSINNNNRNSLGGRPSLPSLGGGRIRNTLRSPSLFERQRKAKRRQSPYRFDLEAMRFLMAGMNGIPELSQSFRLSKSGCVVEADEPTVSDSSGREDEHLNLLGGCRHDDSEEEEDLLPPLHTISNNPVEEVPGRVSVSSTETTDTHETAYPSFHNNNGNNINNNNNKQEEEDDNALDDLVFDHETGTYVYREQPPPPIPSDSLTDSFAVDSSHYDPYETDPALDQYNIHDEAPVPVAGGSRYTLEEMVDCAQIDDGAAFDDDEHEMEISPGVYVPFRGAKETWQAVATYQTLELRCLDCDAHLVCVDDCEYTVCPDCRVVNPVFSDSPKPIGVGMGFKKEWVVKKQMLQAEKERRNSDWQSLANQGSKHLMQKEAKQQEPPKEPSKHRMQQEEAKQATSSSSESSSSTSQEKGSRHKMMQQQQRQASTRRRSTHGLSKR